MDTLAERIAWIRDGSGLRRDELARAADCSPAQIGHLLSGFRTDPAASQLDGLARELGVDLDWIAGGRGEPPTVAALRAAGIAFRTRIAEPVEASTGSEG